MPGRIAGINSLFVGETPITTTGNIEYQTVTTKREPKMAGDGTLAGYKETGEAPYIKFTMIADGNARAGDLYGATNVQIVAMLANGLTVTGHSMTQMEAPSTKADEAEAEMNFIGVSVVEA